MYAIKKFVDLFGDFALSDRGRTVYLVPNAEQEEDDDDEPRRRPKIDVDPATLSPPPVPGPAPRPPGRFGRRRFGPFGDRAPQTPPQTPSRFERIWRGWHHPSGPPEDLQPEEELLSDQEPFGPFGDRAPQTAHQPKAPPAPKAAAPRAGPADIAPVMSTEELNRIREEFLRFLRRRDNLSEARAQKFLGSATTWLRGRGSLATDAGKDRHTLEQVLSQQYARFRGISLLEQLDEMAAMGEDLPPVPALRGRQWYNDFLNMLRLWKEYRGL